MANRQEEDGCLPENVSSDEPCHDSKAPPDPKGGNRHASDNPPHEEGKTETEEISKASNHFDLDLGLTGYCG